MKKMEKEKELWGAAIGEPPNGEKLTELLRQVTSGQTSFEEFIAELGKSASRLSQKEVNTLKGVFKKLFPRKD